MSSIPKSPRELLLVALNAAPERLDHAALAIAALEYPDVDVAACENALQSLASRVARGTTADATLLSRIEALRRVLRDEEGFCGNPESYRSAENSFLNVALQRKIGLPITLSVVYLEVARRAGIPMFGISFPGHFIVGSETAQGKLVIDPFNGGEVLTEAGCEVLLKRTAPDLQFNPKMIAPASTRGICYRMLTNLKRLYLDKHDERRALAVLDLLLAIAPDHPGELRARAVILTSLGAYRAALADVERCLDLSPFGPDHRNLLLTAKTLRRRLEYVN